MFTEQVIEVLIAPKIVAFAIVYSEYPLSKRSRYDLRLGVVGGTSSPFINQRVLFVVSEILERRRCGLVVEEDVQDDILNNFGWEVGK